MAGIDPDLLPQGLPDGWVAGTGKSLGAMVVGLRPSGEMHLGPTEWRLLSDELMLAGVDDLGDLYVTNLVKSQTDTALLREGHFEAAVPYLVEEVQRTVPKYVLALGQDVFQILTGTSLELPLYRGIWQRLADVFDWDVALVLGTFDPAYVLENPGKIGPFRRDVQEFATAWQARIEGLR